MSTRIFNFLNLRAGVTEDEYRAFSRTYNQPVCRRQPECLKYEDFFVKGEANGKPFFGVIEEIEATSFDEWQSRVYSADFEDLNRRWYELIDRDSIVEIYCEEI